MPKQQQRQPRGRRKSVADASMRTAPTMTRAAAAAATATANQTASAPAFKASRANEEERAPVADDAAWPDRYAIVGLARPAPSRAPAAEQAVDTARRTVVHRVERHRALLALGAETTREQLRDVRVLCTDYDDGHDPERAAALNARELRIETAVLIARRRRAELDAYARRIGAAAAAQDVARVAVSRVDALFGRHARVQDFARVFLDALHTEHDHQRTLVAKAFRLGDNDDNDAGAGAQRVERVREIYDAIERAIGELYTEMTQPRPAAQRNDDDDDLTHTPIGQWAATTNLLDEELSALFNDYIEFAAFTLLYNTRADADTEIAERHEPDFRVLDATHWPELVIDDNSDDSGAIDRRETIERVQHVIHAYATPDYVTWFDAWSERNARNNYRIPAAIVERVRRMLTQSLFVVNADGDLGASRARARVFRRRLPTVAQLRLQWRSLARHAVKATLARNALVRASAVQLAGRYLSDERLRALIADDDAASSLYTVENAVRYTLAAWQSRQLVCAARDALVGARRTLRASDETGARGERVPLTFSRTVDAGTECVTPIRIGVRVVRLDGNDDASRADAAVRRDDDANELPASASARTVTHASVSERDVQERRVHPTRAGRAFIFTWYHDGTYVGEHTSSTGTDELVLQFAGASSTDGGAHAAVAGRYTCTVTTAGSARVLRTNDAATVRVFGVCPRDHTLFELHTGADARQFGECSWRQRPATAQRRHELDELRSLVYGCAASDARTLSTDVLSAPIADSTLAIDVAAVREAVNGRATITHAELMHLAHALPTRQQRVRALFSYAAMVRALTARARRTHDAPTASMLAAHHQHPVHVLGALDNESDDGNRFASVLRHRLDVAIAAYERQHAARPRWATLTQRALGRALDGGYALFTDEASLERFQRAELQARITLTTAGRAVAEPGTFARQSSSPAALARIQDGGKDCVRVVPTWIDVHTTRSPQPALYRVTFAKPAGRVTVARRGSTPLDVGRQVDFDALHVHIVELVTEFNKLVARAPVNDDDDDESARVRHTAELRRGREHIDEAVLAYNVFASFGAQLANTVDELRARRHRRDTRRRQRASSSSACLGECMDADEALDVFRALQREPVCF